MQKFQVFQYFQNLEAMGDLKTAINEVNGFVYEGHTLTVQPFVNTADTYSPKTS